MKYLLEYINFEEWNEEEYDNDIRVGDKVIFKNCFKYWDGHRWMESRYLFSLEQDHISIVDRVIHSKDAKVNPSGSYMSKITDYDGILIGIHGYHIWFKKECFEKI